MRSALAMTLFGATTVVAFAQSPPSPYPNMPGTVISKPVAVGTAFPKVGTNPGTPIGYKGPDGQPVNRGQRPAGTVIDLSNLAAPMAAPLPPDLAATQPKSTIAQLYDKWKVMIGLGPTQMQPPSTWTPGLSRRNRDRKHNPDWIRD